MTLVYFVPTQRSEVYWANQNVDNCWNAEMILTLIEPIVFTLYGQSFKIRLYYFTIFIIGLAFLIWR